MCVHFLFGTSPAVVSHRVSALFDCHELLGLLKYCEVLQRNLPAVGQQTTADCGIQKRWY